ncbi:MAG: T9SS type A sorting domain-containing protein [Bacteroidales bacterium]|nr:T9SS type A sorting domain-containing protein [Bacteroidales bacterium]
MKKQLLLLSFFFIGLTGFSQTNKSGTISVDETWTTTGSPYNVTANLTIADGVTLTIQSGVTVNVSSGQKIEVLGTLDATGATITSAETTPAPGDWQYIVVGNSSIVGSATLTDCDILYADHFYLYNGTATLDGTDLLNFENYGVNIRNTTGTLVMKNGDISTSSTWATDNSSAAGVEMSYGGNVTLNNVNISGFYNGLYSNYHGASVMDIDTSSISNGTYGVRFNTNDTVQFNTVSISNTDRPIFYDGPGHLIAEGTNTFTGNLSNVAYIYFTSNSNNWVLPTLNIPYWFISGFTVNESGSLTIGPGNILKSGSSINMNGTLYADAPVGSAIYFTSHLDDNWGGDSNNDGSATAPAAANWQGLRFNNDSTASASVLRRVKIRYAGSYNSYYGSLDGGVTTVNSSPTIDSCEFTSNVFGIVMKGISNPELSYTSIGSSSVTPIAMSFESSPVMTENVLSFSDNQYDAIGLLGGSLTADASIIQRSFTNIDSITYFMLGKITIPQGRTLTIDPGVVIKGDNRYNILVEGTLIANGTESDPIVFTSAKDDNHGNPNDTNKDGTSTTPAIGNFGGIFFAPTASTSSSVDNCIIKYASASNENYYSTSMNDAAIITANVSPSITNNEIKDVNYGIKFYEASSATVSGNNMVNVKYTPFAVSGSADPVFTGNTYSNVGWNALGLLGGVVTQNGTIRKRTVAGYENITYILLSTMTINEGTYVDVEPGVVIKLLNQSIHVKGGFQALGTTTEKIVFTSTYNDNIGNPGDTNGDGNSTAPTRGNWDRILFEDTSDDAYCKLDNVEVSYGGDNYWLRNYSSLQFSNASPVISNTLVNQGLHYGLRIEGNSAPVFDGVTIQNCESSPVGMSLASDPQFSNMSFVANRDKALALLEGTLSSDATLEVRNVAGIDNIAYVLDKTLTVGSNATLTLAPGIVIKSYGQYIYVDGALVADATSDNKITFTSIKDDSAGGDSNDDGNNSVPSPGNWGGIVFRSSGIDNTNILQNCNIRYTSNPVKVESAYALIDSSVIELARYNAFTISGSADPVITNNEIFNVAYFPVRMSMFSNPVFSGNSIANVGSRTIEVIAETYSQSDTIPFRSFADIDSITYHLNGTYTINDGTVLTIPAGMVFETARSYSYYSYSSANFSVNGRLMVEGTAAEPVVFTSFYDDDYGRPLDSGNDGPTSISSWNGTWITFNNVSDDSSRIEHAIFRYSSLGAELKSASPTFSNNMFRDMNTGIAMNGVSEPLFSGNTFHDLKYCPFTISLVAYPALTENNVISGTTYRMIEVNYETLTQDVTLPRRTFGGIENIPYMFNYYTIGTGAILSIDPGVVMKFTNGGYINVQKGLLANGKEGADSTIVFTSIYDDFYGGDSNADGDNTSSSDGSWRGIEFQNTAIDASCVITNGVIKNTGGYSAVVTYSASPTITYTSFINVNEGINIQGSSNPVINYSDFFDVHSLAVNNVDMSFTVDATNNWWGNNSGPTHAGNPDGTGEEVTDGVTYDPWMTMGNNPIMGDVSLNGRVQAYDASLILQHAVASITLDAAQQVVADVSDNGDVSAFDASLILQFSVGLIDYFAAEETKKSATVQTVSDVELSMDNFTVYPGDEIMVPVRISMVDNLYSLQAVLRYDPAVLTLTDLSTAALISNMNVNINIKEGKIYIAAAGTSPLNNAGDVAYLTFTVEESIVESGTANVEVDKFLANDANLTSLASGAKITFYGSPTGVDLLNADQSGLGDIYPNPVRDYTNITYRVDADNRHVRLEVYNTFGQVVTSLVNETQLTGNYTYQWDATDQSGNRLSEGVYYIRYQSNGDAQTRKIQIIH